MSLTLASPLAASFCFHESRRPAGRPSSDARKLISAISGMQKIVCRMPAAHAPNISRRGRRCLQVSSSSHIVEAPSGSFASNSEAKPHLEVKLQEAIMVKPSAATQGISTGSTSYFLSNFDLALWPVNLNFVAFFPGDAKGRMRDQDPVQVLKEALARVLVHYYPLAGRLAVDPRDGRIFVECNNHGVCFVAADANIHISEVGDQRDVPDAVNLSPLVYQLPADFDMLSTPLLTVQVTRFKCGGFVLGLGFCHCMCDGVGLLNFMSAWTECARGVPPSTALAIDRTFLKARTPLQVSYTHPEYSDFEEPKLDHTQSYVGRSFCFTPSSLVELRKKAMEDGVLSQCSAFEALSGLLWKIRTTAMGMEPQQNVKATFAFDARMIKGAGFPRKYVGNGVTGIAAITKAGELEGKPLSYAVKLVQDAKKGVTGEYIRSQIDYLERTRKTLPYFTGSLAISFWARLPWYDIDFGWGTPSNVVPVTLMSPEWVAVLAHGDGRKGMNAVVRHSPQVMKKIDELLHPHLISPADVADD